MKRLLVLLVLVAFAGAVCLAQEAAPAPKPETKAITAKVESVTVGDKEKGTKSEIVVMKGEEKLTFAVTEKTTIKDATETAIALNKLLKGQTVEISYVTKADVKEAVSIKVIAQK